jgi:hypothetical protein
MAGKTCGECGHTVERPTPEFWLTPEGRAEARELFDAIDGNAVRPYLDALEAAESRAKALEADKATLVEMMEHGVEVEAILSRTPTGIGVTRGALTKTGWTEAPPCAGVGCCGAFDTIDEAITAFRTYRVEGCPCNECEAAHRALAALPPSASTP